MTKSLAEKIWDAHVITRDASDLLYIDMHFTHELTSPQPFEGLRMEGRTVRRPDLTVATADHDVPTDNIPLNLMDATARKQLQLQMSNCEEFGIRLYPMGSPSQGIVHVIGPEQGLSLPGMLIVCGDSHTSTHGALGALGFGIGTSQVEHVLATQTLWMPKPGFSRVHIEGDLEKCSPKDVALAILHKTGTSGLRGTLVEYTGHLVRSMSIEGRMTMCNMSIESGARGGLIAPDEITFDYIKGRHFAPTGADWDEAQAAWSQLYTDPGTVFDREYIIDAKELVPRATWGTNPAQNVSLEERIPDPDSFTDESERLAAHRSLEYMGLTPGVSLKEIPIHQVFIGSCTNSRIEDLRAAAHVIQGKKVHPQVSAIVVPGSQQVKHQAEVEGLDKIFTSAGFKWRNSGCSMCIAMNGDSAASGAHVASTSNRNFESRQGKGARTHLVSPAVATASALLGHLAVPADVR